MANRPPLAQLGGISSSVLYVLGLVLAVIMWDVLSTAHAKNAVNEHLTALHAATPDDSPIKQAAATTARQQADLRFTNGRWVYERSVTEALAAAEMVLQDGRFEITMAVLKKNVLIPDQIVLVESARGTYAVQGSTLVLNRQEGARGLVPSSGVLVIRSLDSNRLVTTDGETDTVYLAQDSLAMRMAAR